MPGQHSLLLASALVLAGASCGHAFSGLGSALLPGRPRPQGVFGARTALRPPPLRLEAKEKGSGGPDERELFGVLQNSRLGFKDERKGVSGEDSEGEGMPPMPSVWEMMKGIFTGRDNSVGPSPLLEAVMAEDVDKVVRLLQNGADVNAASRLDAIDGIFDVANRGYTPLREAVVAGNMDLVRILLSAGAEVNYACDADDGATSLFIAAAKGKVDVMRELCAAGADVDVRRYDGATALHMAVGCENLEVVRELVRLGADVNAKTKEGATPVREAVVCGRVDILEALIEGKADLNVAGKLDYGASPMCIATAEDELEVVRALIKGGADVNAADDDGATPVFIAVAQRRLAILQELIKAGANLNGAAGSQSPRAPPPPSSSPPRRTTSRWCGRWWGGGPTSTCRRGTGTPRSSLPSPRGTATSWPRSRPRGRSDEGRAPVRGVRVTATS